MYERGSSSLSRPFWFALFEEGGDPFPKIGGLANAGILADSGLDVQVKFRARMLGEQALGIKKRERTEFRQLRGEFAGAVEQLLRRNDFGDQAQPQGFRRIEDASGKDQIAHDFFADLAQQKSRDNGGHESDPNLGIAKLGFGHSQREIAEQGQSGATGDGGAVDGRDGRLRKLIERTKQ